MRHKANDLSKSSVEFKNTRSYNSMPLCVFMTCTGAVLLLTYDIRQNVFSYFLLTGEQLDWC